MNGESDESALLRRLLDGNARYLREGSPAPEMARGVEGATPIAAVLVCSDLGFNPETLFGLTFGALFVMQTAATLVGDAEAAGALLAQRNHGVATVVVLGHHPCTVLSTLSAAAHDGAEIIAREVHATLASTEAPIGDATPEALARVSRVHTRRMAETLRGRLPAGCGIAVRAAHVSASGEVTLLDRG